MLLRLYVGVSYDVLFPLSEFFNFFEVILRVLRQFI